MWCPKNHVFFTWIWCLILWEKHVEKITFLKREKIMFFWSGRKNNVFSHDSFWCGPELKILVLLPSTHRKNFGRQPWFQPHERKRNCVNEKVWNCLKKRKCTRECVEKYLNQINHKQYTIIRPLYWAQNNICVTTRAQPQKQWLNPLLCRFCLQQTCQSGAEAEVFNCKF